jgi:hypothetical protein
LGYYNISDEEFEEITEGDDYKPVTRSKIEDQRRWATMYSQVFQNTKDDTYWELTWQQGSTEQQECDLEATKVKVVPKQVTKTIYVIAEEE